MDKSKLKNILNLFSTLGVIKSRSMFGGFGIFCNDAIFAIVANEKLYLRIVNTIDTSQMQPYQYMKYGSPVSTKYYEIPALWWQQEATLLTQAKAAIDSATLEKTIKKEAIPTRIKDLPNLRLSIERLLKKAGIDSVDKLQKIGALAAYQALQKSHPHPVNQNLLLALEGALSNTHWTVIPQARRNELLAAINK